MSLYISKNFIEQYKDYIVTVNWPNSDSVSSNWPITGILNPDMLSFNMGANIDKDMFGGFGLDFLKGLITGAGNKVTSLVGSVVEGTQTIVGTIKSWTGASNEGKFNFTIEFNVFKTGENGVSTCQNYKDLMDSVSQLTQTISGYANPFQQVSWQNRFKFAALQNIGDVQTLDSMFFSVSIGDWFYCPRLVPINTDVSFSQYVDIEGNPIYAKVSISFETYRQLKADEWASIIRK